MNPLGIGAALLPGIGQLLGVGKPNLPSYGPQDYQRVIEQFYKMLLNGPIGSSMYNQVGLGANQYQHSLARSTAQNGLSGNMLNNIAGAGANSLARFGHLGVQSDLMQQAMHLAQASLQGQQSTGEFNARFPSGLQAFLGSLGTSAYPLLLSPQNNKGMTPVNAPAGYPHPYSPPSIGGALYSGAN